MHSTLSSNLMFNHSLVHIKFSALDVEKNGQLCCKDILTRTFQVHVLEIGHPTSPFLQQLALIGWLQVMIPGLHAIDEGMGTLECDTDRFFFYTFSICLCYRAESTGPSSSLTFILTPGDNCVASGGFMKACNV